MRSSITVYENKLLQKLCLDVKLSNKSQIKKNFDFLIILLGLKPSVIPLQ